MSMSRFSPLTQETWVRPAYREDGDDVFFLHVLGELDVVGLADLHEDAVLVVLLVYLAQLRDASIPPP